MRRRLGRQHVSVDSYLELFTTLFGWAFYDYGGYLVGMNDDRPLCGMFQRPRPKDREAVPRWFGYLSVGSVERAQRAVTKAGGRVLAAPQKIPKRGEQAVFADPEGALFGRMDPDGGYRGILDRLRSELTGAKLAGAKLAGAKPNA